MQENRARERKNLINKIDFFKDLALFKYWTRGAVAKLTYYFQEKKFLRNHMLYKEGDL